MGVGEIYGYGCNEVYISSYYLSLLLLYLFFFTAASLLLLFIKKKCFSFLFQYIFVITFYVLKIFSRSINTHTGKYGRPTAAI